MRDNNSIDGNAFGFLRSGNTIIKSNNENCLKLNSQALKDCVIMVVKVDATDENIDGVKGYIKGKNYISRDTTNTEILFSAIARIYEALDKNKLIVDVYKDPKVIDRRYIDNTLEQHDLINYYNWYRNYKGEVQEKL